MTRIGSVLVCWLVAGCVAPHKDHDPSVTDVDPTDTDLDATETDVEPSDSDVDASDTDVEDTDVDPTDVDPTDVDPTDVDTDPTDVEPTDVDPTDTDVAPTDTGAAAVDGDGDGAAAAVDCDDADRDRYPGAPEGTADGVDSDCDGLERCYVDGDGDDRGAAATRLSANLICVGDGDAPRGDDCDDTDPAAFPGARELPGDGVDGNCDGLESCFLDWDGDLFGGESVTTTADLACAGVTLAAASGDCDDDDIDRFPGATEVEVDGRDQDCDGQELCFADDDGDGVGHDALVLTASLSCDGAGVAPAAGDCDDGDSGRAPGFLDTPADGYDANCDALEACWIDGDGDGYGDRQGFSADLSCASDGFSAALGDCDDANEDVHPGAIEAGSDGVDSDCDGSELCFFDDDRDGQGGLETFEYPGLACDLFGLSANSLDCDDDVATTYVGAPERLNGVDDDCDPMTTEDGLAEWEGDSGTFVNVAAIFRTDGRFLPGEGGTLRFGPGTFIGDFVATDYATIIGAGDTTIWKGYFLYALEAGAGVSVDVRDLQFVGAEGGDAIQITDGVFTGTNLTFTGFDRYALWATGSIVTLNGATITGNTAAGGVIRADASILFATDLTATDNVSPDDVDGPAVLDLRDHQTGTLTGGLFSGNEAFAGAISVQGGALTINDATFVDGVGVDGGAIRGNGSELTLNGVYAMRNVAELGGALHLSSASLDASSVHFGENTADAGGAIWALGGSIDVSGDSEFWDDVAGDGGAIYAESTTVFASETAFRTCTADDTLGGGEGGAIRLSGGSLTVTDGVADGSAADATGGFAHLDGATWSFDGFYPTNHMADDGGVLWSTTGALPITGTISRGVWSSNGAASGGSALSASTDLGRFELTISLTEFIDNQGPSVISLSSPSSGVLTSVMTGASFSGNEDLVLDLNFGPGDGVNLMTCDFGAEDGVDDVGLGGDRFRWSGAIDTSCVADGCFDF